MARLNSKWNNFWKRGQTWYHFWEDTPGIIVQNINLLQAVETETAFAISKKKFITVQQASEVDTSIVISKSKRIIVSSASETDEAFGIELGVQNILLQAVETDTVQSISVQKRKSLCTNSNYEIYIDAIAGATKYLFFLEKQSDDPYHLIEAMDYLDDARGYKIGESASPTFSITLPDDGVEYAAGIVAESGVGVYSGMRVNNFNTESFIITETDLSQGLNVVKRLLITTATETNSAQIISAAKYQTLNTAVESETANQVTAIKKVNLGYALEVDSANTISLSGRIVQALENDTAQQISVKKIKTITEAEEQEFSIALEAILKRVNIDFANETDESLLIRNKVTNFILLDSALEIDTAGKIIFRSFDINEIDPDYIISNKIDNGLVSGIKEDGIDYLLLDKDLWSTSASYFEPVGQIIYDIESKVIE